MITKEELETQLKEAEAWVRVYESKARRLGQMGLRDKAYELRVRTIEAKREASELRAELASRGWAK